MELGGSEAASGTQGGWLMVEEESGTMGNDNGGHDGLETMMGRSKHLDGREAMVVGILEWQ